MNLLLLSLHDGAVVPFLAGTTGAPGRVLRIAYVADAQVASGDAPFVRAERERVGGLGHEVVEVVARDVAPDAFDALLSGVDAVYVASGSTFALLEALRVSGNDEVLVRHVRAGLPYVGSSAGSIVAGPDVAPAALMDDPSDGPLLTGTTGLGLVGVTVIPHADGLLPPYPPELIRRTLATYGTEHALVPLRDDQALLVRGDEERVVDSVG